MGPINTIYDKAVELAILKMDDDDELTPEEFEYEVFRKAVRFAPLLSGQNSSVLSALRYVDASPSSLVHIDALASEDGRDILICSEPKSDITVSAARDVSPSRAEAERASSEAKTREEDKDSEDKTSNAGETGEHAAKTPDEASVKSNKLPDGEKEVMLVKLALPPTGTFLGDGVRRILPDLVGKTALVKLGADTCFDASSAFLNDHKGCVVFAELA